MKCNVKVNEKLQYKHIWIMITNGCNYTLTDVQIYTFTHLSNGIIFSFLVVKMMPFFQVKCS